YISLAVPNFLESHFLQKEMMPSKLLLPLNLDSGFSFSSRLYLPKKAKIIL
ncbi:MAG: hypothetical protein K1000chlam4_00282, partial [Chlamydiae bacterium]|nr:hypothetical protein [Chlamydiota bacterium]